MKNKTYNVQTEPNQTKPDDFDGVNTNGFSH